MKKKIFALVLAVLMTVLVFPVSAFADATTTTALDFSEMTVSDSSKWETEGWKWDAASSTLTLDGFNMGIGASACLKMEAVSTPMLLPAGTTIILNGENSITVIEDVTGSSTKAAAGFFVLGGLTIKGTGSLTVTSFTAKNSVGAGINGKLTVEAGASLIAKGSTAETASFGIFIETKDSEAEIKGRVEAIGGSGGEKSCGIVAATITDALGGYLKAEAGSAADSIGIEAEKSLTINGTAEILGQLQAVKTGAACEHQLFYYSTTADGTLIKGNTAGALSLDSPEVKRAYLVPMPEAKNVAPGSYGTKNIFANGAPLLLVAGTPTTTNTVIYIDANRDGVVGAEDIIFDPDGGNAVYNSTAEGNDLSRFWISAGIDDIDTPVSGNLSITMTGGRVYGINGSRSLLNKGSGSTEVKITGGALDGVTLASESKESARLTIGGSAKIGKRGIGLSLAGGTNSDGWENFKIEPALTEDVYMSFPYDAENRLIATNAIAADLEKLHFVWEDTGKAFALRGTEIYVVDAGAEEPDPLVQPQSNAVVHEVTAAEEEEYNPNTGAEAPFEAALASVLIFAAVLVLKKKK